MATRDQISRDQERKRHKRLVAGLGPGQENEQLRIYRCAQCLRIKPWEDGGHQGRFAPLAEDEVEHLNECCDECWCRIVLPLQAAYERLGGQDGLRRD